MLHIAVAVVVCAVFREGDCWRDYAAIADAERFLNMTDNHYFLRDRIQLTRSLMSASDT
jgi:hypothetical protein